MKNNNNIINFCKDEITDSDRRVLEGISALTFVVILSQMIFPLNEEPREFTTTAIIMEETEEAKTATIVNVEFYDKKQDGNFIPEDDIYILYTINGEEITIDATSVRIITSEDSLHQAEEFALEYTCDENQIIYYGKDASKSLKLTL